MNLSAKQTDLGTLGGKISEAVAIDGSIVVGHSQTASGETHAFAYDLSAPEPRMIDLGTLGGPESRAVDVDGSIVIGTADTATGQKRAFAYDLAAPEPKMLDLGTLGGSTSTAVDIDGRFIVGNAETTSGETRAFAYDLAAAEPAMLDLGTLGGPNSWANAVDDGVVVGRAHTDGEGRQRAFAYDTNAAEPRMQDLGASRGDWADSGARDVDYPIVVGSYTDIEMGDTYAFAYDLSADQPLMVGLGDLGGVGEWTEAHAVEGSRVVGYTEKYPIRGTAFIYDLAETDPGMKEFATIYGGMASSTASAISGDIVIGSFGGGSRGQAFAHDLSVAPGQDRWGLAGRPANGRTLSLGTWRGSSAADVYGDVVVGTRARGSAHRATAWILDDTDQPMVAFRQLGAKVMENGRSVKLQVERYGRTDRAVTVRYRTRGDTAKPGKEFVAARGKLRFAPGETKKNLKVRILDNKKRTKGGSIPSKNMLITLARPKGGALGTPSYSFIRILDDETFSTNK